jgi:hypothetical protein
MVNNEAFATENTAIEAQDHSNAEKPFISIDRLTLQFFFSSIYYK